MSTSKDKNWTVRTLSSLKTGPHAFLNNQWVGFDDIAMVKRKARFVKEEFLGGIMFWTIDNDDFRGYCHGESFPLIENAKKELFSDVNRYIYVFLL